ncbi:DUF983 domain-containing protein [Litoribacter ruber]|uniref:DUF983 domain-containing protein n=1 Tax=Litoribacter ruber TaxID=702568 RepID=A0AAP2G1H5_9BACT|nr:MULTISPECIES: DUF983 domain-containing protein [Litoribacter]MBS9524659.1 DUF983 domain-containing protein [Litoribacter alkaliphilus]MBT0812677.1 DUF983 domain-containing protein [Litoribacter ruber]
MSQNSLGNAMLHAKCPKCRTGNMFNVPVYSFRKLSEVRHHCDHCGANLHPEPDFYYGALYISYAFSVALFVNVMIILNIFFNDPDLWVYIVTVVVANVILLPFMQRYSKVLYLYGLGKLKYNPNQS